ncbi:hypothetical protein NST70_15325 [Weizmannia sp. FSL K6-0777]|uniref:hypothetical protein n=1 Tax=Weizmannia sp. FSL K6-0777 TaxID=2954674 RepID=UPI003157FA62
MPQKDKREPDPGPIVLLKGSKRQKGAGIRSNCPFGGFKKTKGNWNPVELSFWGLQKDKRELESGRTVLLEGSKGQKKAGIQSNCPFGCLKKTKESQTRGQLSFWRVQKDKRELESGRTVLLEGSKRQKGTGIRANCLFGGFKKTKESWNPVELSFWRVQKDKRELESVRIVLLSASKRQKRARPGANCPFEGFKKTKESQVQVIV